MVKNTHFEKTWKILSDYFETGNWFPDAIESMDLSKPIQRIKKDDIPFIMDALIEVTRLGDRNNLIRFHVDGNGRTVFLLKLKGCIKNDILPSD